MDLLAKMAGDVGRLLKERRQTVAVAETSAGGLASSALLAVPGASAYYVGGGVLYTYDSRSVLLGLPEDAFEGMRPATEAYAAKLALAIRERLGAAWGVSETGAAGPSGNRYGDAAGHSCVAVSGPVSEAMTLETGAADREANMWAFAEAALGLLKEAVERS